MNVTLKVATFYECDSLFEEVGKLGNRLNPIWLQSVTGCTLIDILRDMYKFNVSYIREYPENYVTVGDDANSSFLHTKVDVYARSMSLNLQSLDHAYPMLAIYSWSFYSKPFTGAVWMSLYVIALFLSILFYLLKRWEYGILGGWEASFTYEILMVIGAFCQHIPPIDSRLPSRRIAYLVFFVFAYVIYTFYTSNLLSNLVNDKDHNIELKTLDDGDYEIVIADYMRLAFFGNVQADKHRFSAIVNKLLGLRTVSIPEGLDAVKNGEVALLSDYNTIYPFIIKEFNNEEICKLITVDLVSGVQTYFFTSREFAFKEQFRIGTLRIKETGVLKRILSKNFEEPQCTATHLVQIQLVQISMTLGILLISYLACVLILFAEREHFKRNKVWPYVE